MNLRQQQQQQQDGEAGQHTAGSVVTDMRHSYKEQITCDMCTSPTSVQALLVAHRPAAQMTKNQLHLLQHQGCFLEQYKLLQLPLSRERALAACTAERYSAGWLLKLVL
jgi:hypothetical protein